MPLLAGVGCGVLSAWGIGGGTLLLLVMTLVLDVDQRTAQGINLLFFLPTAASALWCHARNGCLDKPVLRHTIPPALAAALLWGGKATISYDQVFALAAVIVLCSALLQSAALGLTRKEGGHDPV